MEVLDTKGWTKSAKLYYADILAIVPIPPKNGHTYVNTKQRYITGERTSVLLSEKQANLSKLLAEDPTIKLDIAYVKAGYGWINYIKSAQGIQKSRAHLVGKCRARMTPGVQQLANYLKYGSAEEMLIDATWLLNEQVSLYEECRREKQFTQAVRLLSDISTHVDVDAKVSNRLIVEQAVDYAALLEQADARVEDREKDRIIEHVPDAIENLLEVQHSEAS